MPQATDELRAEWPGWDGEAIAYLLERGWISSKWCWRQPRHPHVVSLREYSAIDYLIQEWDFGGIVEDD